VDRAQGVNLESKRLRFATWEAEDWKAFREIATNPLVMRYIGTGEIWPDERIREFVTRQSENWNKYGFCLWKLLAKLDGALVGICGLQPLAESPEVEVGWWLAPAYWGQGLATEAAQQALVYGFEVNKLNRIVAVARPANQASIRIMEKIGMHYEREMVHRGSVAVLYVVTREELRSRIS